MRSVRSAPGAAALLLLSVACLAAAAQAPRNGAGSRSKAAPAQVSQTIVQLGGFRIDRRRVPEPDWPEVQARLERQTQIVADAKVPDRVLAHFRRVPIAIHPEHNGRGGTYLQGRVTLPASPIPGNKPVLLHELLHAYHYEVLGDAAPLRKAYQAALKSPQLGGRHRGAHFLDNPGEYFAVIASIYLFGDIQQPPFDCKAVSAEQPEFLEFLARTFGPHACG